MDQADHRITLLIAGQHELVVIADWRRACWKGEPVYIDPWASVIYFTVPHEEIVPIETSDELQLPILFRGAE